MNKNTIKVSVIIPAFNTEESLLVVLKAFEEQTYSKKEFEVIVIDDGSNKSLLAEYLLETWSFQLTIVRKVNQGRAAARNSGVYLAKGKYIIFCDADRFPNPSFIESFIKRIDEQDKLVCIGNPVDYFGSKKYYTDRFDWDNIFRFARTSNYFSNINKIYDSNGETLSEIRWASFLVGNSCISKAAFYDVGGFDEKFVDWGFEHYDLGIKLVKKGYRFVCLEDNMSFHIPHQREKGFYMKKFTESQRILENNHRELKLDGFFQYIEGKISLQKFEKKYCGKTSEILSEKPELFVKIVNG